MINQEGIVKDKIVYNMLLFYDNLNNRPKDEDL